MVQSSVRPFARTPLRVPLAAILACLLGCQGKYEVPVYPVQGQVTVENVPLTSGIVGFVPDAERGNSSKVHTWGTLDETGHYTVYTEGRAGAPLGFYKILVIVTTPPEEPNVPLPNPKYKTVATTDLHFEVTEAADKGAYDLHLKH